MKGKFVVKMSSCLMYQSQLKIAKYPIVSLYKTHVVKTSRLGVYKNTDNIRSLN